MNLVLVIENDESMRDALRNFLKQEWPHLAVLTAENGPNGLVLAEEKRPDLILVEAALPGMDGFETARVLRHKPVTKSIPLIAITASDYQKDSVAARLCATCNAWLHKPFTAEKLVQVVAPFARSHSLLA